MGKSLKGKELGNGISQRKDGKYTGRFVDKNGKRRQIYGERLQDVKKRLSEMRYEDQHSGLCACGDMTVDAWFEYWIKEIKGGLRTNSLKILNDRYRINIKPYIGGMLLKDVTPLHCQNILNQSAGTYRQATIDKIKATMRQMFGDAEEYEIIQRSPVKKSVLAKSEINTDERDAMTIEEQTAFLNAAVGKAHYELFSLALQTGMRVGELLGLKWDDIDFDRRVISVKRTLLEDGTCNPPKSSDGVRDIPLTQEAIKSLIEQKKKMERLPVISISCVGYVFLTKNGTHINHADLCRAIYRRCDRAGIKRISMHILRHTFATRCIEAGMKPKILQKILGHSKIEITMNLYVHATDDEKEKEMRSIENNLRVV